LPAWREMALLLLGPPKHCMKPEQRDKYSRQILFTGIGEAGQEKLVTASAVLVGCGALGTVVANLLVRAGVGRLSIVDRDFVEPSNLQRQTLFDENDARQSLPKAISAERYLRGVNADANIEGIVADLTPQNALEILAGFSVILDGTDNFETRLLLNDASLSLGTPWLYAAAIGSYGVTMTIRPGETACLACLLEGDDPENAARFGNEATCDTAGVLNTAASVIASLEATEAIKLLAGRAETLHGRLISCDVWTGKFQSIRVTRSADCRACARGEFAFLTGETQPHITICGRDSVQIHERNRQLDLGELGRRLASVAEARSNDFLLRFRVPPYEMTVFADGRAIVKGTKDPAVARSLYARYIGA
jgi:molybdopterin/thiamine biosynthesis adenylyltransferase